MERINVGKCQVMNFTFKIGSDFNRRRPRRGRGGNRGFRGKKMVKLRYLCREAGHIARNCPKKKIIEAALRAENEAAEIAEVVPVVEVEGTEGASNDTVIEMANLSP